MKGCWLSIALTAFLILTGCTKSEVTNADINNLAKTHSQESYEDAMKKAGRSAELEEQKKIASEREQGR